MTRSNTRRLLWLLLALMLPVRFFLGEPETAPLLRLAFLTSLLGSVLAAEGGRTLGLLVGLGAAQTAAYALLLWLLAALLARVLDGFRAAAARGALLTLIVLGLLGASLSEIYQTSLSSQRPRSNLFQIFD